jgi:hypothetical protein
MREFLIWLVGMFTAATIMILGLSYVVENLVLMLIP